MTTNLLSSLLMIALAIEAQSAPSIPEAYWGVWTTAEDCSKVKEIGAPPERPGAEIDKNALSRYEEPCLLKTLKESRAGRFAGVFSCPQEDGSFNKASITMVLLRDGSLSINNEAPVQRCQ